MKICESFFSLRNTQNRLNKENYISFKITLKLSLLRSKQTFSTTHKHFVKTFSTDISESVNVDRNLTYIVQGYYHDDACWMLDGNYIIRVGIFNVQLKKKRKRLNYFFSKKNFLNFFYQTCRKCSFPHLSLKYTDTFR